jgi:thymidine kinase
MFSGKTRKLLHKLNLAALAGQSVILFKPTIDNRYSDNLVVSHDGTSLPAVPVSSAEDIRDELAELVLNGRRADVVGIDEAQFFDEDLAPLVEELANIHGVRVMISGLDLDFKAESFGPMPQLLCLADKIKKCKAVCAACGRYVPCRSFRLTEDIEQVKLGDKKQYSPLCRTCFQHAKGRK